MSKNLNENHIWLLGELRTARHGLTRRQLEERYQSRFPDRSPLHRKVFNDYRHRIEEICGITINCDKNYRYYIDDTAPLNKQNLQNWMMDSLSVSDMVSDTRRLYGRVLLERIPSGQEFLPKIMEAIRRNVCLRIEYKRFGETEAKESIICPYCARVFKQRWYIAGPKHEGDKSNIRQYALDRVESLEVTDIPFELPDDFDAAAYYKDCYGIFDNAEVTDVILKVSEAQRPWIRTLKLHSSQEEIEENEEYSIFKLRVRPTFDFVQQLMSYGWHVTVLEPEELRQEMIDRHYGALAEYGFFDEEEF